MSVQGLRRQALSNVYSSLTQTRNRPFEIRLVPTHLTGMAPRRCGSEAHSLRVLARCREVAWPGNAFPGRRPGRGERGWGGGRGVRQAGWAPMAPAGLLWISQTAWLALHSKQYYCQTRLSASSGHGELKRADSWAVLQCILPTLCQLEQPRPRARHPRTRAVSLMGSTAKLASGNRSSELS